MPPQPKLRVVRPPRRRKPNGFTISATFISDVARLSSGHSCTLLLLALWARSAGGSQQHDWTPALAVRDLAQLCRCSTRTIERLIVALCKRGVAEIRRPGKGEIEARLRYRDWKALSNRKSAGGR